MRRRRVLTAGLAIVALVGPPTRSAAQDAGIRFLDDRPIVVDLDQFDPGDTWTVSLHATRPGVVVTGVEVQGSIGLSIESLIPGPLVQGQGRTAVLRLNDEALGTGRLLAIATDGSTATRAISTVRSSQSIPLPTAISLSGTRSGPFSNTVRVRPARIGVSSATGGDGCSASAVEVGRLAAQQAEDIAILSTGCTLSVRGISQVGTYQGVANLTNAANGGVDVSVRVRDAWGWPALVLATALMVVSRLDLFKRRSLPRRVLFVRLSRLRDRVAEKAARTMLPIRLDPLVERECTKAASRFDEALDDPDRAKWALGGQELEELEELVERCEALLEDFAEVFADRSALLADARPADHHDLALALQNSVVGAALGPRKIATPTQLDEARSELTGAAARIKDVGGLYRRLRKLADSDATPVASDAERLLHALFGAGPQLADLAVKVAELEETWRASVRPVDPAAAAGATPPSPAGLAAPPAPPVPVGAARPAAAREAPPAPPRRARATVGAGIALLLLLALAVPISLVRLSATNGPLPHMPPTSAPEPTPTSEAPAPPAPTEIDVRTRLRTDLPQPSSTAMTLTGVVLPIGLGVIVLITGSWLSSRRKPAADTGLGLTTHQLTKRLAADNRRFALLSGFFVVASGLSVLYAPNPGFGSGSDYLALALWGGSVGEGVQFARRFLPGALP